METHSLTHLSSSIPNADNQASSSLWQIPKITTSDPKANQIHSFFPIKRSQLVNPSSNPLLSGSIDSRNCLSSEARWIIYMESFFKTQKGQTHPIPNSTTSCQRKSIDLWSPPFSFYGGKLLYHGPLLKGDWAFGAPRDSRDCLPFSLASSSGSWWAPLCFRSERRWRILLLVGRRSSAVPGSPTGGAIGQTPRITHRMVNVLTLTPSFTFHSQSILCDFNTYCYGSNFVCTTLSKFQIIGLLHFHCCSSMSYSHVCLMPFYIILKKMSKYTIYHLVCSTENYFSGSNHWSYSEGNTTQGSPPIQIISAEKVRFPNAGIGEKQMIAKTNGITSDHPYNFFGYIYLRRSYCLYTAVFFNVKAINQVLALFSLLNNVKYPGGSYFPWNKIPLMILVNWCWSGFLFTQRCCLCNDDSRSLKSANQVFVLINLFQVTKSLAFMFYLRNKIPMLDVAFYSFDVSNVSLYSWFDCHKYFTFSMYLVGEIIHWVNFVYAHLVYEKYLMADYNLVWLCIRALVPEHIYFIIKIIWASRWCIWTFWMSCSFCLGVKSKPRMGACCLAFCLIG